MSASTARLRVKTLPPLPAPGERWALFLDVDGSLLDFCDDPDMVHVPTELHATLVALHVALDGALALVSGRRLYDIDRLFGPPLTCVAALHGLQRRRHDGSEEDFQPAPEVVDALQDHLADLAARWPRLRVENKGTCASLHYREHPQLQHAAVSSAERLVRRLPGYEAQPGDHVIEIKPDGVNPGSAVKAFLAEPPFAGRRPVYLGDDLADEHGFALVNARDGISIRVGRREPTRACFGLRHPTAVQAWLEGVLVHL